MVGGFSVQIFLKYVNYHFLTDLLKCQDIVKNTIFENFLQ